MEETEALFQFTIDGYHIHFWPDADLYSPPPHIPTLCGLDVTGGHVNARGLPKDHKGAPDYSVVCAKCMTEAINAGILEYRDKDEQA